MDTRFPDEFKQLYHHTWWALVLRGLLALAVGIFIFARPIDSIATFALVIAFWALFAGIVEIVHAIQLKRVMKHWWVVLLSGVVGVGFGVAALIYYPFLSLAYAVLLFVWWLMLTGVLGIYGAYMQRKLGVHWGWTATFGVLSIVAAVFAFLAPPVTLLTLMTLMGAFAIAVGIALIFGAFKVRSVLLA